MKKILLVEDDLSIRELLVEIFENEGYQVSSSLNGLEGIKSLQTETPDLIVMDIMMPVMDGYAFRKEMLADPKSSSIPLLALSAQTQSIEKLADYGITNFIKKPLELDELLEAVRNLLKS